MDFIDLSGAVKKIFSKRKEIIVAYLYGSFLTSKKNNDIDIGLLTEKNFQRKPLYEAKLAGEIEKILKNDYNFKTPVDLRILNGCSLRFTNSVLKQAKILYSKDEMKRINFETYIFDYYLDIKPHYDYYDKLRRIRYASKY